MNKRTKRILLSIAILLVQIALTVMLVMMYSRKPATFFALDSTVMKQYIGAWLFQGLNSKRILLVTIANYGAIIGFFCGLILCKIQNKWEYILLPISYLFLLVASYDILAWLLIRNTYAEHRLLHILGAAIGLLSIFSILFLMFWKKEEEEVKKVETVKEEITTEELLERVA